MNAERIMDELGDAGRCVAHMDVADTLHFYILFALQRGS